MPGELGREEPSEVRQSASLQRHPLLCTDFRHRKQWSSGVTRKPHAAHGIVWTERGAEDCRAGGNQMERLEREGAFLVSEVSILKKCGTRQAQPRGPRCRKRLPMSTVLKKRGRVRCGPVR